MSAYLCQFSPVRIRVSTPHRCLSLQTVQAGRTWEFFYPCLHLKDSFGCTMHVRVVKAKPLRLFCSTSLAQIHFSFYASVLWQWVQGGVGVVWVVAADATPGSQASAECFAWNTAVTAAAAANRGLFSFACGQHESACTSFFFFFTWWSL